MGKRSEDPPQATPLAGESRQVRRARARREAKATSTAAASAHARGETSPNTTPAPALTDPEIRTRIRRDKTFARLWHGDLACYPTLLEGDLDFCRRLVPLAGRDPARIDRLFRQSGRYRSAWDAIHDGGFGSDSSALTYGASVIARAIADDAVRTKAIAAAAHPRSPAPALVLDRFPQTDSGNAEFFAARWGHVIRRDHARKEWFLFDGQHWSPNRTGDIERRALEAIRARQRAAIAIEDNDARQGAVKWALQSESRTRRDHMLTCAASVASIAVDGDDWDSRPLLLGVKNGVLDLETDRLRSGDPADAITKVAPVAYDPRARCPRFERFITEIFKTAPELVPYIQRVLGYTLTALTGEQVFWILFGTGANGKSTLLEIMMKAIFGARDYAWIMPCPVSGWSNAMSEYQKAGLVGRRFVSASEIEQRAQLNEAFVKALTGEDTLNARHPYGRPFQFVPVAKFFLRVNDKPLIRDQSHGMWRRVKLVPFLESFPIDRALSATLSAEGPGILRWCVEGCRDWQRDGLRHPAIVEAATEAYRAESDPLAQFYGACCTIGQGLQTGGRELFTAYCLWCNGQQMPTVERLSQRAFGTLVKSRFPDVGSRTVIYSGVALNPEIKAAATTCAPSGPKSLEELGLQEEGQVVTGDSLDDLPTCGPLC